MFNIQPLHEYAANHLLELLCGRHLDQIEVEDSVLKDLSLTKVLSHLNDESSLADPFLAVQIHYSRIGVSKIDDHLVDINPSACEGFS